MASAHLPAAEANGHSRGAVVIDRSLECRLALVACGQRSRRSCESPLASRSNPYAAWLDDWADGVARHVVCAPAPVARRLGREIGMALGVPLRVDRSLGDAQFIEDGFVLRRIAHEFRGASVVVIAPGPTIQSVLGTALTGRAAEGRRFAAVAGAVIELEVGPDGRGVLHKFTAEPAGLMPAGGFTARRGEGCRVAFLQGPHDYYGSESEGYLAGRCLEWMVASLGVETIYTTARAFHLTMARRVSGRRLRVTVEPGLGERVDQTKNGLRTTLDMPLLRATFARVSRANLGRTIGVVAHPWVVRSLICHAAAVDQRAVWRIATTPAAFAVVGVDGCGRGIVASVNQLPRPDTGRVS